MGKGLEIKLKRIKAKIRAIDLAKQINISPSKISLIENEHIDCPEDLYLKIENFLDTEQ